MALDVSTAGGQLTVNGVDMIGPAWQITNLIGLWRKPTVTIINRRRTGQLGRKAYPPIIDETHVTVPIVIIGDCDQDGTPYDNKQIGLESNLNFLIYNVLAPVDPSHSCTLTMPSGETRTGIIQFGDMPIDDGAAYSGDTIETTLEIILPSALAPSIS